MKITIEQKGTEFFVSEEKGENIFPKTRYKNARLAVARVLQLLELGPVGPQTHPEDICIGSIETDNDHLPHTSADGDC